MQVLHALRPGWCIILHLATQTTRQSHRGIVCQAGRQRVHSGIIQTRHRTAGALVCCSWRSIARHRDAFLSESLQLMICDQRYVAGRPLLRLAGNHSMHSMHSRHLRTILSSSHSAQLILSFLLSRRIAHGFTLHLRELSHSLTSVLWHCRLQSLEQHRC